MSQWRTLLACLLTGVLMLTSSLASAQQFGGTGVAGRLGTPGWGLEVIQALHPNVNLRFGFNRSHGNFSGTEDQVDYTVDVRLRSVSLLADWHPYNGVFRVTAGVLVNGNKIEVAGTPNESLRIGNSSYAPSEIGTLTYDVGFRKLAPYLGFGFGNALQEAQRFGFVVDFGLAMHGFPTVDISASGWNVFLPGFQADLAREERELEEDLQPFRFYPVIACGLTYRFR